MWLWQVTSGSAFMEPDVNVLFSKVHACGQNCIMLTCDNAVATESAVK
jgi:hypothetical protein